MFDFLTSSNYPFRSFFEVSMEDLDLAELPVERQYVANPIFSPLLYSLQFSSVTWFVLSDLLLFKLRLRSPHGSQFSLFFRIKLVFGVEESLLIEEYLYMFLFVWSSSFILVILEGVFDELYLLDFGDCCNFVFERMSTLLKLVFVNYIFLGELFI